MTTFTVDTDKAEDLDLVKKFLSEKGINFKFDEDEQGNFKFTDIELKQMLDERYRDYVEGKVEMVTAEESKRQIQELLNSKR